VAPKSAISEEVQKVSAPPINEVSKYAGRLKLYLSEWYKITNDTFVLNAISGYTIPFRSIPTQSHEPTQREYTVLENSHIDICIAKLLNIGAIVNAQPEPDQFVSTIFAVPKSDGSFRLILNLKKINEYIDIVHFKMEDYRAVCNLLQEDSYMASVDLQDAYHLIPVLRDQQKYLRFRWRGKLYQYTCLPFGLATAPRVFTKVMRPVMASLRSEGNLSVQYLDDILLLGLTKMLCNINVQHTVSLLKRLGFLINVNKSELICKKRLKYLGFIFDTSNMTISLPPNKREKLMKLCRDSIQCQRIKIRKIAELIGHLVAASPAVSYSGLYTRQLEFEKSQSLTITGDNYQAFMSLSIEARSDIEWWMRSLPCSKNLIRRDQFDYSIETDASPTGWGARYNDDRAHGFWDSSKSSLHINKLELEAAELGLHSFFKHTRSKSVLLRMDNTTAIAYINRLGGCRSHDLHTISKRIWSWCEANDLWISASYLTSAQNYFADKESRRVYDPDSEWSLNSNYFRHIEIEFGVPEIDLFASYLNFKCRKFISWHPDPSSSSVDAFTISWTGIKFYAFPPFCLIPRVLRKIRNDKARGIVVAPLWNSQPWYPMYMAMKVSDVVLIGPHVDLMNCPVTNRPHPMSSSIWLMAAVLSSSPSY